MSMAKFPLSTGLCALLLAYATADAESIEHRAPADPRGVVEIDNVSGSVRVFGWDRAEVEVTGELGDDVERLEFKRDDERTVVKVLLPRNADDSDSDLLIRIPRDSRLVVNTVSADQIVEDVRDSLSLRSVSGDIQTQVWGGEFEVKSVSGDVIATGKATGGQESAMRTRASTVSGDLILNKIGGDMDVTNVSGDVRIDASMLTRAHIQTTNGDLILVGPVAKDLRFEAEAINGDLSVELKEIKDAEIDLESFNGEISSCFGPKPKRKSQYGPGIELRFKEGAGGAQVRMKTLNGDIRLCR